MNVSIVIPNYNGRELLKKNLPKVIDAVFLYKKRESEIIVVDDCSTDNSLAEIENLKLKNKNYSSKIKVIRNEKNLGFSSAVNRGVEKANGEIIVLLNTDVIPEKRFLEPLLQHFEKDENIFAVGCMDKSIEDGKIVLRGRGVGFWKRGFLIHARGEVNETNTLWVGGGSGAFRKKIWNKLNGFSSLYNPFYWEDIDISYRAVKSGYRIVFEAKSIVTHEHEKGAIKRTYSDFAIKAITYRNQFIFVWKNVTDLNLQFLHLFWLPYYFIKALIKKDLAFFKGIVSAFVLLPKIIEHSVEDQKLFVLKDRQVVFPFSK